MYFSRACDDYMVGHPAKQLPRNDMKAFLALHMMMDWLRRLISKITGRHFG